ncbi:MAG: hypothetical protein KBG20_15575 [Caldilineaceae bacterium]|nr:hypothetical protein [Caldilineaceae bacterium]MBP8107296.1 hypothetical protein [Caldilineaceae bacterium]MBP8123513.1 hypothetical protein [Caldilineaceae bacterium]MBP9073727.1 hypothetical protein [Caldilineaceae bacterium]
MNRRRLTTQKLIAIFLLGGLLLNYPLLSLFGRAPWVEGIPGLYVYLFVVWIVLIGLMAWVIEGRAK